MSEPSLAQLTLVKTSTLARDVADFVIDARARGLPPRTVEFYSSELGYLLAFLKERRIFDTEAVTASHLRQFLLQLPHSYCLIFRSHRFFAQEAVRFRGRRGP